MATIEQPSYEVTVRDGTFELRQYAPRIVAETQVASGWSASGTEGFRRLAAFIFGRNHRCTKLAMTAPVGQRRDAGGWIVSFNMPAGETLATLPTADDTRVVLRELAAAQMAVVTFSGRCTDANLASRTAALRRWMAARGLATVGEPEVNRYDPPWKPWFLRRNEVWLAVVAATVS